MKCVFIINPVAGKGKGEEMLVDPIKKYFSANGGEYEIVVTSKAGDVLKAAKAVAQSGEKVRIFACGGEGTAFEAVNGIVGFDNVELGVLPCGSANDFLKFFERKEPFLDIAESVNGIAKSIDLIKANDRYCINGCSVGMDAVVADDMRLFKRLPGVSGRLAYKLAIVKTFLRRIGMKVRMKIDGEYVGEKDCLFAVCANGPYYGGGFKSCPDADPFDRKLDFTVVDTISKFKVLSFLKSYENGEHAKFDFCTLGRCESMEIEADKPFPVNLDGEIVHDIRVKFEIVKKAVKFVVPLSLAEKDEAVIAGY